MAYQASAQEEKKPVPLWAIAAAGIALLGLMGWWGYKNFGPQDPPLSEKNIQVSNMLEDMAKKCNGDFSKLSPEDQAKVKSATGPYAGMVINNTARKMGLIK